MLVRLRHLLSRLLIFLYLILLRTLLHLTPFFALLSSLCELGYLDLGMIAQIVTKQLVIGVRGSLERDISSLCALGPGVGRM